MHPRVTGIAALACAALVLFAARSTSAAPTAPGAGASARAFAVKIVVPGQDEVVVGAVTAPPDGVAFAAGFAYPQDGSAVTSGTITASASVSVAETAAVGSASSETTVVSLFNGEITVDQVLARATATAQPGRATGDLSGAALTNLVVLGQPVEVAPALRLPLADWGYAILLAEGSAPATDGYRGFLTALDVHLTADHGGLPAGSEILVGYAETAARAVAQPAPPPQPKTTPKPAARPRAEPRPRAKGPQTRSRRPLRGAPPVVRNALPSLTPRLTKRGYVFPVYGPSAFTDTFGAARAVVGWHHGEDIFAPLGAPILAVAKGTVFSVGWNDIGGNRLWLRDTEGNEFYYAHLSAFTPLAVDGAHVEAGDVLGFVGNSGDAEATPPHLHFEIHPVGLLGLGYDGVISAYRYLLAWRRVEDVRFVAGAAWLPGAVSERAPRPGAYLLSSSDISTASGLEPGSLRRALAEPDSAEAERPVLP